MSAVETDEIHRFPYSSHAGRTKVFLGRRKQKRRVAAFATLRLLMLDNPSAINVPTLKCHRESHGVPTAGTLHYPLQMIPKPPIPV